MSFSTPLALGLLLIGIPLIVYIGFPRHSYRRTRDIASLILRCLIVVLLVLALAGVQVAQSASRLAVVFLVDVSDSMGATGTDAALEVVRDAMAQMGADDLAGVVVFGATAQVERPVSDTRELPPLRSAVNTGNTDIASAIRLALALFPADTARRIVIVSDGYETLGNARAAAQLAAASGVQISYIPITRPPTPEVAVTRLSVPSVVPQGQRFDLDITITADHDTPALVEVFAGGTRITSQQTLLRPGDNNRTLTLESAETGFRDFTVRVTPGGEDGFYQNNTLSAFTQVIGQARVALVSASEIDTRHLQPALEQAGVQVDRLAPSQLPSSAAGLVQYDSVLLVNVPATRLNLQAQQALQTFVRDLGGGLIVVGGPEAYGPGGYFQTPLEATLPVEMQLRDQQRLPQLTVAYVIDRSGSMAVAGDDGIPLIELAKAAINRSIDFLQPTDRVGIATFDAVAYWIAQFQNVGDRRALQELVATLRPSGGTDIRIGMELVARDIIHEESPLRHIILLTDGIANPAGLVALTETLKNVHNVTTTTIAIGFESSLLEAMAIAGGGNYHISRDAASIPLILAQETVLATRSYIFEETFTPTLTAISPIMQGIDRLPPLLGYVGTTPKLAAQVVLTAPEPYRDPILAAWQYGLGRSVAFTSDATARWATEWVTWDDYARFWNQVIRWTITEGGRDTVETRIVTEDDRARIIVDARDSSGAFLNGLELLASVVTPAQTSELLTLRQVAPGRYEALYQPRQEGAYLLRLSGQAPAPTDDAPPITVSQTTGWVQTYSPEYQIAGAVSVLPELATLTGGRSLAGDLSGVFSRDIDARTASQPLAPWLLVLAMCLLPLDIAVRRLIITASDRQRLRQWLAARRTPPETAPAERIASLMSARERARQRVADSAPSPADTVGALRARRTTDAPADPPPPLASPPRAPAAPPPVPSSSGENIGARLLKKRHGRDEG